MKKGFDSKKYIKIQSAKIKERIKMFDKLYLEFGGKLVDDYHAMRVLPGFESDVKINLLQELKDQAEVIFCINANDIERNKIRADYNISYDLEILRLIDCLKKLDIMVNSVVVTLYNDQPSVNNFIQKLKRLDIKTYVHTFTKGYPTNIDLIVSDEGYGANTFIETTRPLVVVSAPGPCSGKLATCLSQLYHENKRGVKAGYAKFETFPVWDLSLNHPVNIAYEAGTADLKDKNMIDYFHLEKYGISAVNYNRDLEVFPVLKEILYRITNKNIYHSPTDMGVNVIGQCIVNDKVVSGAACQEIIRRYYRALVDYKKGIIDYDIVERIKLLMNQLGLSDDDRSVIKRAREKQLYEGKHAVAIELGNGKFVTGKQTDLLSPVSGAIINSIKELTRIPDEVYLLSPSVLEPIIKLKNNTLNEKVKTLKLEEVLIALSILSVTNPVVEKALYNLKMLNGCELHSTYIIPSSEVYILNKLGICFTSDMERCE